MLSEPSLPLPHVLRPSRASASSRAPAPSRALAPRSVPSTAPLRTSSPSAAPLFWPAPSYSAAPAIQNNYVAPPYVPLSLPAALPSSTPPLSQFAPPRRIPANPRVPLFPLPAPHPPFAAPPPPPSRTTTSSPRPPSSAASACPSSVAALASASTLCEFREEAPGCRAWACGQAAAGLMHGGRGTGGSRARRPSHAAGWAPKACQQPASERADSVPPLAGLAWAWAPSSTSCCWAS